MEILGRGRYVELVSENGWEYVRRNNNSGIVVLIPVTADREILLVEQYRPPVHGRVIELPAGLAGDIPGEERESFEIAAQRELVEETGFRAGTLEFVWRGPVSAGLSTEVVDVFRATDLEQVGEGGGDESEDIVVHRVPLAEVESWLSAAMARGVMVSAKVWLGLWFARESA